MSRRLSVLLIWSCVAASAVFWSLRLLAQPLPLPESSRLASAAPVQNAADWTRLLGTTASPTEVATPAVSAAASRFRLVGVAATGVGPGPAVEVALIAVDGAPPRAFRVGQRVVDSFLLHDVSRRGATLASGSSVAETVVLEMPLPTAAATGSLGVPQMPAMPIVGNVPLAPAAPAVPAVNATASEAAVPPQTPDLRNSPLAR